MDDVKLYGKSQQEIEPLVHIVNIFFDDLCMQIGDDKCNIVAMARGHVIQFDGVVLSSRGLIQSLSPVDVCKYLGILEADTIKHQQMKNMLMKEYKQNIRKLFCTKLCSRNVVSAINVCAVSLLYGILEE